MAAPLRPASAPVSDALAVTEWRSEKPKTSRCISAPVTPPLERLGCCDITAHDVKWISVVSDETVRKYAFKIIKEVLGENISRMSVSKKQHLINLYFLYLKGEATVCPGAETPGQRLAAHVSFIQNIELQMRLHGVLLPAIEGHYPGSTQSESLEGAALEASTVDDRTKSQKFIEVIRQLSMRPFDSGAQYRDVGGGTGAMASEIAKAFGIHAPKIYEIAAYRDVKCPVIQYGADGSIPEGDSTIDFATMNMVLHHVQNPDLLLKELHRVMKPGALFLMRETDTQSHPGVEGFQQFMDQLWYKCNPHSKEVDGVPLELEFRDQQQITTLFASHGFMLTKVIDHPNDSGNVFHSRFFCFQCSK